MKLQAAQVEQVVGLVVVVVAGRWAVQVRPIQAVAVAVAELILLTALLRQAEQAAQVLLQ